MLAVRASSALPRLGGRPPVFRGERMADGGLIEPIPLETALNEGATHVLVLRSRPPGYRRPALRELGDSLAVRDNPALLDLFRARRGSYNRQAAELEHAPIRTRDGAHVQQVAVPDGSRLVGRLENNGERVTEALRLGAKAMASAIFTQPIDLCWQPVVYRATATPAAAAQPAGSPAALQAPVAPVAEAAA
jgi:predicted patatin/cPLA2 family phospholipase